MKWGGKQAPGLWNLLFIMRHRHLRDKTHLSPAKLDLISESSDVFTSTVLVTISCWHVHLSLFLTLFGRSSCTTCKICVHGYWAKKTIKYSSISRISRPSSFNPQTSANFCWVHAHKSPFAVQLSYSIRSVLYDESSSNNGVLSRLGNHGLRSAKSLQDFIATTHYASWFHRVAHL